MTPDDDLISDQRARVEYDGKQKSEPIPPRLEGASGVAGGGCASIAGEFYHRGQFRYCRDPRTCKAEATASRNSKKVSVPA